MNSPAFEKGRMAFRHGKKISDCPYDCWDDNLRKDWTDWHDGWMEGDYEEWKRIQRMMQDQPCPL
jgi:hypothetical protein